MNKPKKHHPHLVSFDPETGARYVCFTREKVKRTVELVPFSIRIPGLMITLDLDEANQPVGIEIIGAP